MSVMLWPRSWPMMDDNRGKVLFVLVDSTGKYGPLYRQQFPDLRNATFFVSQPGEPYCCWHTICDGLKKLAAHCSYHRSTVVHGRPAKSASWQAILWLRHWYDISELGDMGLL